jgi:RHS repeat-associated protein
MIDGTREIFEANPSDPALHRLKRVEDRFGNFVSVVYDAVDDRIDHFVVNHPSRVVRLSYDAEGRISAVVDFTGRAWTYDYDEYGDLVAVTTPPTNGFPFGTRTAYEYTSSGFPGVLAHNISRITDAAGHDYLECDYGTIQGLLSFNRVVRERRGSGEFTFEYEVVIPDGASYTDQQRPAFQTNFMDRNGQVIHFVYNRFGNLLLKEERVIQAGEPRVLQSQFRYNRDGSLLASLSPEGVLDQRVYGRDLFLRTYGITDAEVATHDELTEGVRRTFPLVLAELRRGRRYTLEELDLSLGVWADIFPDVLGTTDPADIIVKRTYEPDYGQLLTVSDPRSTTRADPNFAESPEYAASLTKYEYKGPPGDSHLLLARIIHPTPMWPDGTSAGAVIEQYLSYDGRGRLEKSVDVVGVVTERTYFDASDPQGREGFLRRMVVDPAGRALTTEYDVDSLGRRIAVTSPRAKSAAAGRFVTRYGYDARDRVVQTTTSPPFSFAKRTKYDANGSPAREEQDAKDEQGTDFPDSPQVRTWKYDDDLDVVEETLGGADLSRHLPTRHAYDAAGMRIETISPAGRRIRRHYDERNLRVAMTRGEFTADAATARTGYDGDGNVHRMLDGRGFETRYTRDVSARVIEKRDPLGNLERTDYDKAGDVLVERAFELRPDGSYVLIARSEYEYDVLNRRIREHHNRFDTPLPAANPATDFLASPGSGKRITSQFFHDAKGRVLLIVDPLGHAHELTYEIFDSPAKEVDARGNRIESRFDEEGNLVRRDVFTVGADPQTGAVGVRAVFSSAQTFDELNRLASTTDGLGNTTRLEYDSLNHLVRRTDPLGRITRTTFDVYGWRRTSVRERVDSAGNSLPPAITTSDYDPDGNLVAVVDALGRTTQQKFDSLNRRRSIRYPDGALMTFDFDPDAHLVGWKQSNGLVRRYTVDALGRVIRVDVGASGSIEGGSWETYEFDARGRRLSASNDFAQRTFHIDSLGWCTSESLAFSIAAAPFPNVLTIARVFDDNGATVGFTFPNGRKLRFDHNEFGQIERVVQEAQGTSYPGAVHPSPFELVSISYEGALRASAKNGNKTGTRYAYDAAGRLIDLRHVHGAKSLLHIQQLFDASGSMRTHNDIEPSGTVGEAYGYDALVQLAQAQPTALQPVFNPVAFAPGASPAPDPIPNRQASIDAAINAATPTSAGTVWRYDLVGNRVTEDAARTPSIAYTVNDLDQYTSVGSSARSYDANGNLVADATRTYHYDSLNRLVRVVDATSGEDVVRFFHDADGRRVADVQGGAASHFVHDGDSFVGEYRNGALFAEVVRQPGLDAPLHLAAEGKDHWYHLDLLGSVRMLTDGAGVVSGKFRYTPFGRTVEATGPANRIRYAGRSFDAVLDSYDMRAREYVPEIGRFLQRDPSGMSDGTNLYAYVRNDPLAFIDPRGTDRQSVMKPRLQLSEEERARIRREMSEVRIRIVEEKLRAKISEELRMQLDQPTLSETPVENPRDKHLRNQYKFMVFDDDPKPKPMDDADKMLSIMIDVLTLAASGPGGLGGMSRRVIQESAALGPARAVLTDEALAAQDVLGAVRPISASKTGGLAADLRIARSGWSMTPGAVNATGEAMKMAEEMGIPFEAHFFDQGVKGQYFASHVETQLLANQPGVTASVSRIVCHSCYDFAQTLATQSGMRITLIDPSGMKVFTPGGTFEIPLRALLPTTAADIVPSR